MSSDPKDPAAEALPPDDDWEWEEDEDDLDPETGEAMWEETDDDGAETLPFFEGHAEEEDEDDEDEDDDEDDDDEPDRESRAEAASSRYPEPPCYVTIGQGDCVLSLARRYRLLPKTIWDATENTELREARDRNILLPGDRVFIPAVDAKDEQCNTGKRHRFQLKAPPAKLKLTLMTDWEPRAGLAYTLTIGDTTYEGTTDDDGKLEHDIDLDARSGTLTLHAPDGDESIPLRLGHMNPVEDTTGVQARLNNLGFGCGAVDGDPGPRTREALATFQTERRLTVTGELDEETRRELEGCHGS